MTAFDLRVIVRELQSYIGSHVKKAYMPHYEQIVLRLNPKQEESIDLVMVKGQRIYTARRDRPMPMHPPMFAMMLRKHLKNARLIEIEQVGFDRIIQFTFDTKDGKRVLFLEVFRDGNVILCDEDHTIIQPLTHASYAGRTLKKGEPYLPPPEAANPYALSIEDLDNVFTSSDRDLVSTLGGKLNLGASYANALCHLAGFEPNIECQTTHSKPIHLALSELLSTFEEGSVAYALLRDGSTEADTAMFESATSADDWMEEHIDELVPVLLPQHKGIPYICFERMIDAVNAWKGRHDAHALQRRNEERDEQAAPGRGQSTDVERFERRLAQQERALAGFEEKIEQQQSIGHAIQTHWNHVDEILRQTQEAVETYGWELVKQRVKGSPWINSVHPANRTITARLPDEDGQPCDPAIELRIDDSVHQNAQRYFELARTQKNKSLGAVNALEDTRIGLKRAHKKESKQKATGKLAKLKRSKRMWFEHHRWGIVSGGHLVIGGKDAKGNDTIVKKHLSSGDLYFHADLHGAPSCSLRFQQGIVGDDFRPNHLPAHILTYKLSDKLGHQTIDEQAHEQAATLALAWSRAWNSGGAHGTVYSVLPSQVSKTAQTGEFVGKGAFIIRGQRTWYKDLDLKIAIGIISVNGVPLPVSSSPQYIEQLCPRYIIIQPGVMKKERLANSLYQATGIPTDDWLAALPGHCDIMMDHKLLSPPTDEGGEEE